MDIKELRKNLGIDDYLELVKEDRNCHGAYISFGQYMYLLEKENQDLKKQLEDMTLCRDIASGHRKEVQDRETILLNQQKKFVEWLENEIALWERKTYEIAIIKDDTAVFVWKIKLELLKEVLSKYKEIVGYKE